MLLEGGKGAKCRVIGCGSEWSSLPSASQYQRVLPGYLLPETDFRL